MDSLTTIRKLKENGIEYYFEKENAVTGKVNVGNDSYLNLRKGSDMDQDIIGHLFTGEDGDWYQVTVMEWKGYVHKDYVELTENPADDETDITDKEMLEMLLYLMQQDQAQNTQSQQSSGGLTPDGNLTLVDDYKQTNPDGSGKQFITVTTKDGNYFYLVIDRDEDGDENVHFVNLVDKAGLLALMDEDEAAKYTQPVPTEPAETEETESTELEEKEPEEEPQKKSNPLPALILLIALMGGGRFFVFTKMKGKQKAKEQEKPDSDADYVEGEDDTEFDLPDDIGEIDSAEEPDGIAEADDSDFEEEDESTMFDAEDNELV